MKNLTNIGLTAWGYLATSVLLILATAISFSAFPPVASAQEQPILKASFAKDANQIINIDLVVGQSRVIELDEGFDAIQYSGDKIVSATALTGRTLIVNALGIGQAQVAVAKKLTAPNQAEETLVFRVYVQKDLTLLDNAIKILYPKENIQLSQVNDSVVISGSVTRPEIAEGVMAILKTAKVDYTNLLKVPVLGVQQVQMQVRIAEVNRSVLRELSAAYGIINRNLPGYINPGGPASFGNPNGVSNTSGGLNTQNLVINPSSALNIFLGRADLTSAFIRALNSRGAIRDLAEPNIIAQNKAKGSFLAGGELPIPIVQSAGSGVAAVTVQYRPYGVKLEFTPTILDENHIQIELEPEVSTLDYGNAITLNGTIIPSIRLRKAKTTLELRDGQSFALAGLIDSSESVNYSHIPGLGSIPLIGELFKSRRFQRNESELVFLCTVTLVEPLNPDQIPRLPGAPPGNTNAPAKPNGDTSGASLAPLLNNAPATLLPPTPNVLEGESGHVVPKKAAKVIPKSDN